MLYWKEGETVGDSSRSRRSWFLCYLRVRFLHYESPLYITHGQRIMLVSNYCPKQHKQTKEKKKVIIIVRMDWCGMFQYTVGCLYNAVQSNTILHTSLHWAGTECRPQFEFTKDLDRRAMGCLLWGFFQKTDRVITAPCCMFYCRSVLAKCGIVMLDLPDAICILIVIIYRRG